MNLVERTIEAAKSLFEKQRVGMNGLPAYPDTQRDKLFAWGRKNDLVYACIAVIADAALDPSLIVQRRKDARSPWEVEPEHPVRQLLIRPNPTYTEADFFGVWLASEECCGEFFAEIVRDQGGKGKPVELWPLDPTRMIPAANGKDWIWRDGGEEVTLLAKDVFHTMRRDWQRPWEALAPLGAAVGSVEADSMQTSYVRGFFKNGGVPSGILKLKGKIRATAKETAEEVAEGIAVRWARRLGLYGKRPVGPAVLDEDAEYQKVGSNLDELEGSALRAQIEARICGVFRVPPLLVSAYVGLLYVNQRASAREAQRDFWHNKMSPTFKRMRVALNWALLPEYEDEHDVRSERVRLNWDMSQVLALQESESERSMRAREDFRVGGLTLNEFREEVGRAPIADGDYYLRAVNRLPVTAEILQIQLQSAAAAIEAAISLQLSGNRDAVVAVEDEDLQDDKETGKQND